MTSDLFHDTARAYYGIGPEVYAAGCAAKASKYAGISDTEQLPVPEQVDEEDRPHQQEFEDKTEWLNEGLAPKEIQGAIGFDVSDKENPGTLPWGRIKPQMPSNTTSLPSGVYQKWADASENADELSGYARKLHSNVSDAKSAWDAFQAHSNAERAHHRAAILHAMFGGREYANDHWRAAKLHGLHADRMSRRAMGNESYTLANIATYGNAPASCALDDDAPATKPNFSETGTGTVIEEGADQYAVKPMKGQPSLFNKTTEPAPSPAVSEPSVSQQPTATAEPAINRKLLGKYNPLAGDLFRAAELLSKHGLHKDAARAHGGLARYFGALAKNTNDMEASRFARYHSDKADFHSGQPAPSGMKGYTKPAFAQPETIPDSPGQKHMFASSQPYALGDAPTETGSADDDPQVRQKSADGMYPAQARPVSQWGNRVTLPGDAPPKPNFSETGTGGHVKVQVPEKNCAKSGCGKSK